MAIRLDRNLGPATALSPKQWTDRTASGEPAVCCPGCGEVSELEYPHVVDKQSGRVRYRWACPSRQCGYIEFLVLEHAWEDVV